MRIGISQFDKMLVELDTGWHTAKCEDCGGEISLPIGEFVHVDPPAHDKSKPCPSEAWFPGGIRWPYEPEKILEVQSKGLKYS